MTRATVEFDPAPPAVMPTTVTLVMTHEDASLLAAVISGVGGPGLGSPNPAYSIFDALRNAGYIYDGSGKYSARAKELYNRRRGLHFE